jgi:hypothetical protein
MSSIELETRVAESFVSSPQVAGSETFSARPLSPEADYCAANTIAVFPRFNLRIPDTAVREITAADASIDTVGKWTHLVDFGKATPATIRAALAETRAWDDEELHDDDANRRRIILIGAWNIADHKRCRQSERGL